MYEPETINADNLDISEEYVQVIDRKHIQEKNSRYRICRRAQDIVISLLVLAVLWPFLLIVALIIYIDNPHGSSIFSQTRIGRDGKPFKLYKLRSMYVDAEERFADLMEWNEMDGPVFKMKNDPRITRVGHFIRRCSIDELPQFINVLRGDMSIVGPRPALPQEVEQYNDYEKQRLYVKPGITCYWQVYPHRNEVSFDKWMDLDIKYIQERNIINDWKIIFKTVGAVFRHDGE